MPPTAWMLAALLALATPLLMIGQRAPMVREERRVVINGQPEVWRLEWTTPPRSLCGPEDPDWASCLCWGFAFGESGKLDLVRLRQGQETERFPLAPLFEGSEMLARDGDAVLRRWDVRKEDWNHENLVHPDRADPVPGVRFRAPAAVMGVSRQVPRLRAFGTSANPDKPLVMDVRAWAALLHARSPTRVVVWECGDHGSDTETELELSAVSGAIHVTSREFQCTENFKRGKLTSVKPFASQLP